MQLHGGLGDERFGEHHFSSRDLFKACPFTGLPTHGATFVSHLDANHSYKMAPSYAANNIAYVGAANIPGNLRRCKRK